jgi:hypothetical protein
MRIHLDGDILVYRCGFAAEKGEYTLTYVGRGDEVQEVYTYNNDLNKRLENLGNPPHTIEFARRPEPVQNALHNVNSVIASIKEELQSDDLSVYLSGGTNFRDSLGTIKPYKGNRDRSHKPVHSEAIKDLIRTKYNAIVSENEEADDVIGYMHYAMWEKDPLSTVIATTDKDLNMIPGLHYDFVKKVTSMVSDADADRNFFYQLLVGDPVDNVIGVRGLGPSGAKRVLEEAGPDPREAIRKTYAECYGSENAEVALRENVNLLWIRRKPGERCCLI